MGAYNDDEMIISASKNDLLEILRKNLKIHKEQFVETNKGWKDECKVKAAALTDTIANVPNPQDYKKQVEELSRILSDDPVSHISDYEIAIEMLEWHQGDEFKVERTQFRQYVQDNWSWKGRFSTKFDKYVNGE